jgi:hypothetical protein
MEKEIMDHKEDDTAQSKILRKMRGLLDRHGWTQKQMGSEDVGFCAVGALCHSTDLLKQELLRSDDERIHGLDTAHVSVRDNLCRLAGCAGIPDLVTWNDDHSRTREEVLDLVDRALARVLTRGR